MADQTHGILVLPGPRRIRFGPFEADLHSGELRKRGIKVRIGQQSFGILRMLLEHPSEVVLRDEIRLKLWPEDTTVAFDHSINAAIQKLRDALGESAGNPRFIETLPRRGYRFIGTIELPAPAPATEAAPPASIEPLPEKAEPAEPVPAAPRRRRRLTMAGIAAAALLALLAAAGWRSWMARTPARSWILPLGDLNDPVVSPDGSAVLYRDSRGLLLRRMDTIQETSLYAAGRLVDAPAWSPDGSQVVFRAMPGLYRLALPKGPLTLIGPHMSVTRGMDWGPGGTIVVAVFLEEDLLLFRADGGTPTRLHVPGLSGGTFYYPEFLPDGKNLLFAWAADADVDATIYLATVEGGQVKRGPFPLFKNATPGHYSPARGGRLLYMRDDKLYAQKIDIAHGKLEGAPERVMDEVFSEPITRHAQFSVSRDDVLVWRSGRASLAQMTWFDRTGKALGTVGPPCYPDTIRLSPDESHVLFARSQASYAVAEVNRDGFLPSTGVTAGALWMPASSDIIYPRKSGSAVQILRREAAGGPEKEVARVPEMCCLLDISQDGRALLYLAYYQSGPKVYALRLEDAPVTAKPELVAEAPQGKFSPDGRWVVYSDRRETNSRPEVYVQAFPSRGLPTQISVDGGRAPVWRGDGKEILYLNGSTIYSVRVEARRAAIDAGPPLPLFNVRVPAITADVTPLAVTRDGSRILFEQAVEQPQPQLTYMMTAWDARLNR
jgi:DNA-binding winged helix-turn-helix (wHTH) protein/Tol biopolymer transport system component